MEDIPNSLPVHYKNAEQHFYRFKKRSVCQVKPSKVFPALGLTLKTYSYRVGGSQRSLYRLIIHMSSYQVILCCVYMRVWLL